MSEKPASMHADTDTDGILFRRRVPSLDVISCARCVRCARVSHGVSFAGAVHGVQIFVCVCADSASRMAKTAASEGGTDVCRAHSVKSGVCR